jgi:prevent-host-death family protein
MERVGIGELRRHASAILRRVAAGETFEVTDRGRPVAVLVRRQTNGLDRLANEEMIRRAQGDLLKVDSLPLPEGAVSPSERIERGRGERPR